MLLYQGLQGDWPAANRRSRSIIILHSIDNEQLDLAINGLAAQVQTYQISTMTVSQRNALARTWMEEGNHNNNSNLNQLPSTADAAEGGENDSSSSNDGNDEPQKDVLETWMIMVGEGAGCAIWDRLSAGRAALAAAYHYCTASGPRY